MCTFVLSLISWITKQAKWLFQSIHFPICKVNCNTSNSMPALAGASYILELENISVIIWSLFLFRRWKSEGSGFKVSCSRLTPQRWHMSESRASGQAEIFTYSFLYDKNTRALTNTTPIWNTQEQTAMPLIHLLKNSGEHTIFRKTNSREHFHLANQALLIL